MTLGRGRKGDVALGLRLAVLSTTISLALAGALRADPFCEAVETMHITINGGRGSVTSLALPSPLVGTSSCQTSLALSGGQSQTCGWAFAYRSEAAQQAFDAVLDALVLCLGKHAAVRKDTAVNHPDFYDLRLFRSETAEIAVSIKDKGALQETYVFLRVAGL